MEVLLPKTMTFSNKNERRNMLQADSNQFKASVAHGKGIKEDSSKTKLQVNEEKKEAAVYVLPLAIEYKEETFKVNGDEANHKNIAPVDAETERVAKISSLDKTSAKYSAEVRNSDIVLHHDTSELNEELINNIRVRDVSFAIPPIGCANDRRRVKFGNSFTCVPNYFLITTTPGVGNKI